MVEFMVTRFRVEFVVLQEDGRPLSKPVTPLHATSIRRESSSSLLLVVTLVTQPRYGSIETSAEQFEGSHFQLWLLQITVPLIHSVVLWF
jgi:hypothetical protein